VFQITPLAKLVIGGLYRQCGDLIIIITIFAMMRLPVVRKMAAYKILKNCDP
jgi:hypothetical protein